MNEPINMVLHCPACGAKHIDRPAPCVSALCADGCALPGDCIGWTNPPHRSHLCEACGFIWRPADVPTNGVQAVQTRGQDDSPLITSLLPAVFDLKDYARVLKAAGDQIWGSMQRCNGIPASRYLGTEHVDGVLCFRYMDDRGGIHRVTAEVRRATMTRQTPSD
jgi:hypothetical protein